MTTDAQGLYGSPRLHVVFCGQVGPCGNLKQAPPFIVIPALAPTYVLSFAGLFPPGGP